MYLPIMMEILVRFTMMASQVSLLPQMVLGNQSSTFLTLKQARIMETMAVSVS